jgi:hypothetical protein
MKPKHSKNGLKPINARIKIEYSGKLKPKISFSYPQEKTQFRASMFSEFILFSEGLIVLFLLFNSLIMNLDKQDYKFTQQYTNDSLERYTLCVANNSEIIEDYKKIKDKCDEDILDYVPFKQRFKENVLTRKSVFMLGLFLLPLLIYFPFKKKWDKLYPKWQGLKARKKLKIFTKRDILIDKENKYYVELPIFNNIVCNFKAIKDFSKYLELFEIEEYKFYHLRKKRIKTKKGHKKYFKKNELIWYARWYFKERPIKGELRVIYK